MMRSFSGDIMGTYNHTVVQLECPRCGHVGSFQVDLYFGNTANMVTIPMGDLYPFVTGAAPQDGGPFPGSNPHGVGYTECSSCQGDFHCVATIQDGRLVSVAPDRTELPYIPDREITGRIPCPECHSFQTRLQICHGFTIGRILCEEPDCHSTGLVRLDSDDDFIPYCSDQPPNRNA